MTAKFGYAIIVRNMQYEFDPQAHRKELIAIIREIERFEVSKTDRRGETEGCSPISPGKLNRILRRHARDGRGFFSRSQLIAGFRAFASEEGFQLSEQQFAERLRMRPVRTQSGLAPLTVFTKPFACPGKCIYCPTDPGLPKSYLADEPGVQRAVDNHFDPYLQVWNRLQALKALGHSTDKIELIISGGTWSAYPERYQIRFVSRCFEAMNDFGKGIDGRSAAEAAGESAPGDTAAQWEALAGRQRDNEAAGCRCVGLGVETRPDYISEQEVLAIRRLGGTKVQIGCQSLSDSVLAANRRGHDVQATRTAVGLLRAAGFKILLHWMPNLLGATIETDRKDFARLFDDPDFCPDELKIYPCALVKSAELEPYYRRGEWNTYPDGELLDLIKSALRGAPRYCRITRVIRDISSGNILAGNRRGNLRELAQRALQAEGIRCQEIRGREIRSRRFDPNRLRLEVFEYRSSAGREQFLELTTPRDELVGFARLTLPDRESFVPELARSALIREARVYGAALDLGFRSQAGPQHQGLGRFLIETALGRARAAGFARTSIISAVGTRDYYRKLGFYDGELYQHRGD